MVAFIELWIVLLYSLLTDGSSLNQSAIPFSKTGFFDKLRIVLMILSDIEGLLSVNRE